MLSWITASKRMAIVLSVVFILLLLACGILPLETTDNVTPNVNSAVRSAALTMAVQTLTAIPTSPVVPTNTSLPPTATPTFTPTPTRTPLPFVKLDGLRVAYTISGNLYVQDSGEQPVQLTHSGQDHDPIFSDDGQKVAFVREWKTQMNELRLINADGTEEQVLFASEPLTDIGFEPYVMEFVPGTHLLLFSTRYFMPEYPKTGGSNGQRSYDLLLVDTDTGELKQLKEPGQGGYFLASPNGKQIAVQTPDHVDVIDIQGQIIRRNLVTYSPDDYDFMWYGYMWAPMSWTQDSSELLLVQPIDHPTNRAGPLARTVWRYPLDGRPGFEVRLKPASPMGEMLSISPDGNWIAFSLFADVPDLDGVYLGNLRAGTSQLIYQPEVNPATGLRNPVWTNYYGWSPDSIHFVFSESDNTFMGNIYGETTLVGRGGICGWIDKNYYLDGCGVLSEISTQKNVRVVEFPQGIDRSEPPVVFVFLGH